MKEKIKILGIIALAAIFALSMIGCDDTKECEHVWDLQETVEPSVGTDGSISDGWDEFKCKECGEEKFDDISATKLFYGTWKPGAGNTYIVISENGFKFYETATTYFELTDITFKKEVCADEVNNPTGSNIASVIANYKQGYGITGTKGGTALQGNENAGVYINVDENKIICRLNKFLFNNRADDSGTDEVENNRSPYVYTKQVTP